MSKLHRLRLAGALLPKLRIRRTASRAADEIRKRDAELDAQLRTTISATMLNAGTKINVIPNAAEAQLDIRRLPTETREEVFARLRKIDRRSGRHDRGPDQQRAAVHRTELADLAALPGDGEGLPAPTAPNAMVVPFLMRGTTDGAYLRAKGMAVYGVPLFPQGRRAAAARQRRAHGDRQPALRDGAFAKDRDGGGEAVTMHRILRGSGGGRRCRAGAGSADAAAGLRARSAWRGRRRSRSTAWCSGRRMAGSARPLDRRHESRAIPLPGAGSATGRHLFSGGFASIFGEWQETK